MRRIACAVILAWIFGCAPWREEARTWAPEQAAISKQLRAQARRLSAAGAEFDVEPLWAMTREARIIGIGEATHGTREFREVRVAGLSRRLFVCQKSRCPPDPTAFATSSLWCRPPSVI